MSTEDDQRREDEAAREAHSRMSNQELQDARDHAANEVAKAPNNGYFQREEQRIREEMKRRAGAAPKTDPRG